MTQSLTNVFDVSIESEGDSMLITYIAEVKVDFVKMAYPILFPPLIIENVRMLEIRDIAPMKLKAIVQRGSKKDFFDLYFLLQDMSLEEILSLFQEKFKQHETFHIIKSLTYFEDAEGYAEPILFDESITWTKVKLFIKETVKKLL